MKLLDTAGLMPVKPYDSVIPKPLKFHNSVAPMSVKLYDVVGLMPVQLHYSVAPMQANLHDVVNLMPDSEASRCESYAIEASRRCGSI